MKLYATIKNERGGKKSTSDDTRILVELSYKNKILGTIGLYAIIDENVEGFRIVWREHNKPYNPNNEGILMEEETNKSKHQQGEICAKIALSKNINILG